MTADDILQYEQQARMAVTLYAPVPTMVPVQLDLRPPSQSQSESAIRWHLVAQALCHASASLTGVTHWKSSNARKASSDPRTDDARMRDALYYGIVGQLFPRDHRP
jgi:hypothetical protein